MKYGPGCIVFLFVFMLLVQFLVLKTSTDTLLGLWALLGRRKGKCVRLVIAELNSRRLRLTNHLCI